MSNPNLILNGNFNLGDKDFTSSYRYVPPNPKYSTAVMDYTVLKDPGTQFANGFDKFGDHTTGTGKMLFVDGTSSGVFWSESPTLAANTTYNFTYFATSADPTSPAEVALSANGSTIDSFQVTGTGGGSQWQQVTVSFTTGTAGAYSFSLGDLNNATIGNDLDIDDISLRAASSGARGTSSLRPVDAAPMHVASDSLIQAMAGFHHLPALAGVSAQSEATPWGPMTWLAAKPL